jgi:hypothetical protein
MNEILYNYLKAIVGPTTKLHVTVLVVEREPGDINFTGGFEYSWWDVGTAPCIRHHHICWISSIEGFVSTRGQTQLTNQAAISIKLIWNLILII